MDNPDFSSKTDKPDLSKTAEQLSASGKELKEKASQVASDVKEHASASAQYVSAVTKEKLNDGFNALNDYIKNNPLTSVVAAVSFGYVVGWLRSK
jgi:ElaB/YqjD/DUF883 family membrane-anchored ribosome-binding protein